MSCSSRVWNFYIGSFIVVATTQAREWNDVSGVYSIEAELVGFNEENVVLQREDHELGMIRSEELSEKDREFLKSGDAQEIHEKNINGMQTWTTRSGLKLVGRIVDFAHGDVTIQRRRRRIYVNDQRFNNFPELYQKLLPEVIEH